MELTFEHPFYESTETDECWLTNIKTKQSRVVTLRYPGWQYMPLVQQEFNKRGFIIKLR